MSQQQSARRLYRLHLGLAGLSAGLVAATAAHLVGGVTVGLPSPRGVAAACNDWLTSGGLQAIVVLAVGALAVASIALGLRSAYRQTAATRRYLRSLSISGEAIAVERIVCSAIETDRPQAFCAGYLRPRIYLSRGAVAELNRDELQAVLAHELHHVRRRDPLRLLVARSLAEALFFVPLLRRSGERYAALGELAADEAAVSRLGRCGPLASALLRFSASDPDPAPVVGIAPERVDHLMGDPRAGRWRLPVSLAGGSALALVGLAALLAALLHGALAAATVDLPVLLGAGCMLVMIGGPIALALVAVIVSRRAMRARRI